MVRSGDQLLGHTLAVMVPMNDLPPRVREFCRRHNPPDVKLLPMLACSPFRVTPPIPHLSGWEGCVQVELGRAVSRTAQAPFLEIGFDNSVNIWVGGLRVLQATGEESYLDVWSVTLSPTKDQAFTGLQNGIMEVVYECEYEDRMIRGLDFPVVPVGELILAQGILGADEVPELGEIDEGFSPFKIEVNTLHWINISAAPGDNGSSPKTPLLDPTATSFPVGGSDEVYLAAAA